MPGAAKQNALLVRRSPRVPQERCLRHFPEHPAKGQAASRGSVDAVERDVCGVLCAAFFPLPLSVVVSTVPTFCTAQFLFCMSAGSAGLVARICATAALVTTTISPASVLGPFRLCSGRLWWVNEWGVARNVVCPCICAESQQPGYSKGYRPLRFGGSSPPSRTWTTPWTATR